MGSLGKGLWVDRKTQNVQIPIHLLLEIIYVYTVNKL